MATAGFSACYEFGALFVHHRAGGPMTGTIACLFWLWWVGGGSMPCFVWLFWPLMLKLYVQEGGLFLRLCMHRMAASFWAICVEGVFMAS